MCPNQHSTHSVNRKLCTLYSVQYGIRKTLFSPQSFSHFCPSFLPHLFHPLPSNRRGRIMMPVPEEGCGALWVGPFDGQCYQVVSTATVSWHEARDACRSQGGDLLGVSSPRELQNCKYDYTQTNHLSSTVHDQHYCLQTLCIWGSR